MVKFLRGEQKTFYAENGFVQLENVFSSDEVEEMSEEYDRVFQVIHGKLSQVFCNRHHSGS
jgi:hypothetical protein